MAIQDLTPQLRTRLSRVERAVGWFVILATLLLITGFSYYVYQTAKRKGWFLIMAPYFTFLRTAAGLHVGDKVQLMGFDVGTITKVEAMPAEDEWARQSQNNIYIEFVIKEPYYGYIWTDSKVKAVAGDLLGNRYLEITKGNDLSAHPTYKASGKRLTDIWADGGYQSVTEKTKPFWLIAEESPALNERLDTLVRQAESALPGIFDLTNQISQVLTNTAELTGNASSLLAEARPAVTNLTLITSFLTNGNGSLGDWLIPTNLNVQLQETLATANTAVANADTNVAMLAHSLNETLLNLANITSNLNTQVQSNDQILSHISRAIVDADDLVQGLKRHWLLRSAFKKKDEEAHKTNAPVRNPLPKIGKQH